MKVIRAKSAGFCRGVERAVRLARELAAGGAATVYTDGPLIHNRQLMSALEAEGIREWTNEKKRRPAGGNKKPVVLIRAHGITPRRREHLKSQSAEWRDATCPDVGRTAGTIKLYARKGYDILIFGEPEHPEAEGLMGYAGGRGHVIRRPEDLDNLPPMKEKVLLVSQSTMLTEDFEAAAKRLKEKHPGAAVLDTICAATKERQKEVGELAEKGAEALVVIGGRHSANTVRLARLARRQGRPVYHVESANELDEKEMAQYKTAGVTAGASTPAFLIDEVCRRLEAL